jgi:hypothetical protein
MRPFSWTWPRGVRGYIHPFQEMIYMRLSLYVGNLEVETSNPSDHGYLDRLCLTIVLIYPDALILRHIEPPGTFWL